MRTSSISFLWLPAMALGSLLMGCLNDPKKESMGGRARYVAAVNIESSAFLTPLASLEPGTLTNADGFEVGTYPYVFVHGNTVLVTQNIHSDELLKFERDASGALKKTGSLDLPSASFGGDIVFADDTTAYVALVNAGKIAVVNPVSMQVRKSIDLTGGRYAVGDSNPDPGNLLLHRGRLWVTLMQQKNLYEAFKRVDIAVIDLEGDTVERVISDTSSGLAQAGYPNRQNLFVDDKGDLYVYCIASAGYFPGQNHGFLRVKAGEDRFDPEYTFDITAMTLDVEGGLVNHFNTMTYAGEGIAYGAGNVPALASNPPDYLNDKSYFIFKIDLYGKSIEKLPIAPSTGYSGFPFVEDGKVYAAMATAAGSGIYRNDAGSGNPDAVPFILVQGFVSKLVRFPD